MRPGRRHGGDMSGRVKCMDTYRGEQPVVVLGAKASFFPPRKIETRRLSNCGERVIHNRLDAQMREIVGISILAPCSLSYSGSWMRPGGKEGGNEENTMPRCNKWRFQFD